MEWSWKLRQEEGSALRRRLAKVPCGEVGGTCIAGHDAAEVVVEGLGLVRGRNRHSGDKSLEA